MFSPAISQRVFRADMNLGVFGFGTLEKIRNIVIDTIGQAEA